jgi:hypothetical protein
MDAFAPSAIPLIALHTANCATVCVADAPMVEAMVMQHETMTLPRLPRKFSCRGSANVVPNSAADISGMALSIPA